MKKSTINAMSATINKKAERYKINFFVKEKRKSSI